MLRELKEFGRVSDYTFHFEKSELMPINAAALTYPLSDLPIKTSEEHFKYLSICITKDYSKLFDQNFSPLLTKLSKDLQRWSTLPFSLAGRINCIKINMLTNKFLYISLNAFLFSSEILLSFIWQLNNSYGTKKPQN